MHTFVFFDCETTGFIEKEHSVDPILRPDAFPRLVCLAWMLCKCSPTVTHKPVVVARRSIVVKPNGFVIDEKGEAFDKHRITQAHACETGVDVRDALIDFEDVLRSGATPVAHNAKFDQSVILAELSRVMRDECAGASPPCVDERIISRAIASRARAYFKRTPFCTMRLGITLCRLSWESRNGGPIRSNEVTTVRRGFRAPKLSELHRHAFDGRESEHVAHEAIGDVQTLADAFFALWKVDASGRVVVR